MKKLVLAAVGALGLASASVAALPAAAQPLPLVQADYWCGPGWHLDGWNRCVPNYRPYYGYYGPTFVLGFGGRGFHGDFHDRGFRGGFRGGHHR